MKLEKTKEQGDEDGVILGDVLPGEDAWVLLRMRSLFTAQLGHLWAKRMSKSRKEKRSKLGTNSCKYEELKNEIGTSEEKPFSLSSSLHSTGGPCGHGVWRGAGGSIDPVVASAKQPHDRQGRGYRPQERHGGASSSCSGGLDHERTL